MTRQRLLHLTSDDFEWSTYRSSGPGGQYRNKTDTSVRCHHPPSGVTTQAGEHRSQLLNKRAAFRRMFQNPKFQQWLKLESAKVLGSVMSDQELKDRIDRELSDPRITKIEYIDTSGG